MFASQISRITTENNTRSTSGISPDWSVIPSSGMNRRSDQEIISDIKRLASVQLNTSDKTELKLINDQKIKLQAEYISDVSPDRKSLYREAKKTIKKEGLSEKSQAVGEKGTLLYYLNRDSRTNTDKDLASKRFPVSGGAYVNFPALTTGGYGVNVFFQGKRVLSNLGNGWAYEMTQDEWKKGQEFNALYDSALGQEVNFNCEGKVSANGIIYEHEKIDILM